MRMMPNRLRKGWTRVAFGDVIRLVRERSADPDADGFDHYVGLEHLEPGDLRIRRWGNVAAGTTFTNVFRVGQVLFGKRRVYQHKVAVADFDGVCSSDIYVLEPKSEELVPGLLPFICQTDGFFEHAVGTSAGSLSPRTNWDSLAAYEFALPPLEEQRRIEEALLAHRSLRECLLEAAQAATRSEYALLEETFGEAYDNWQPALNRAPLSELAEVQTGLAMGRKPDGTTTRMPYLRVANVLDGALDLREMKEIVVEKHKIPRYSLRRGDVLMTEGGDLDKLGRGTVWQGEIQGCLHQNHVFAVRPDLSRLEPWFLAAVARSPYGRSFFLQSAKRTSNLASVNKKQVSGFLVPLMPLSKQREWLKTYNAVRASVGALSDRLRQLDAFGDRIMQQGLGA